MRRQKRRPTKHLNESFDVFTNFDEINFLTENQYHAYNEFKKGKNLILSGFAGTGKSYLACDFSLDLLNDKIIKKIHIVRSATQARNVGHLPGTLHEKLAIYEEPFIHIINEILNRDDAYSLLRQKGMVNFHSTSFMRGLTYDDSIIIVDESQNMNFHELYTIMTRLGENTRIIFCGDYFGEQCDLRNETSGFAKLVDVVSGMENFFSVIQFSADDIVRSALVKEFIIRTQSLN